VLTARRVLLRPLMVEDTADLSAAIDGAHDDDRVLPCPRGQVRDWIATADRARRQAQAFTFLVVHRQKPAVIGAANLTRDADRPDCWTVGYWIVPGERRQGYGTEAVASLIAFGFDELAATALEATVPLLNQASIRVLKGQRFRPVPGVVLGGANDVGLWQRRRG
jgi:RimJ/RimL family protein N-acetyltransferase